MEDFFFWFILPLTALTLGAIKGIQKGIILKQAEPINQEAEEDTGVDCAEIWHILMPVYTKLRQAGAWLPVPWISSCIEAIEEGRECSPEAALAALIETGEDLAGTRWDTDDMADVFAEAAGSLAALI